jgi:ribosomal protein L37E
MAFRDEYGAGHGTFGYDGNPQGLLHIIDLPAYQRLYRHPPCERCGVQSYWSTPEPQECGSCARGRVARNENVVAVVARTDAPEQIGRGVPS